MYRWIFTSLFFFFFNSVFSQIQGEAIFEFSAKENQITGLSEGTIYDSGGPSGDYKSSEKSKFTICPDQPHQTINLTVVDFRLERGIDILKIYDSAVPSRTPYSVVTGSGKNRNYILPGGCITLEFESDKYLSNSGFELKWTIGDDIEMMPPPSDCSNPTVISTLPFSGNNLSTCGAGNDYWITPCNSHLLAEEMIFVYDSPGDECVEIIFSDAKDFSSITVYDDCPNRADDCMAEAVIGWLSTPITRIPRVFFENPGRYYFMVSVPLGCTEFNIEILPVDCPNVLPSAATCEDALPITGCNNLNVPSIITVQQGQGDESFLVNGVNDGCWGGYDRANFTWFKMEAQTDGKFAFLLSSEDPVETSDIDIQVWGPILDPSLECSYAKNNEPVRSTFANEKTNYDLTGLTDLNPIYNSVVSDICEDEFGDGFVKALNVRQGEIYMILVNDYDGIINSGAVSIDFGETTPGVLGNSNDNFKITADTVLCSGNQLQLNAEGGLVYRWLNSPDLSCLNCPNPIATPSGNSTYSVIIGGVCETDTLSVNVSLPKVELPDDFSVCQNENAQITAVAGGVNAIFTWTDPNGFLSCSNCASPEIDLPEIPGFYTFEVEADFGTCKALESITIEVLDFPAPENFLTLNTTVCAGDEIELGSNSQVGVLYYWKDENGNLISSEANPKVSPANSQWYFINLEANGCKISDSVFIEVFAPPVTQNMAAQTICPGAFTELNFAGDTMLNYTWTDENGIVFSTESNPVVTPEESTVYQVEISTHPSCPNLRESVEVTVHPKPELNLEPEELSLCSGDSAILTANANLTGGLYDWSTGDTTSSITISPSDTENYSVFFTDENNCETIMNSIDVFVGAPINIDSIIISPNTVAIYEDCELSFTSAISPQGMPDLQYLWTLNGQTVGADEILTYKFETADNYSLVLSVNQNGGCEQFYEINFPVLKSEPVTIPNIFSPNGDGINDFFKPIASGKQPEILDMMVFNRWGNLVYNNQNNDIGWDGTVSDEQQTSDIYIYKIRMRLPSGEEIVREGDVTLYR